MNWKLSFFILFIVSVFCGNLDNKKLFRDLDRTKFKPVRRVIRTLIPGFNYLPMVSNKLDLKNNELSSLSGIEKIENISIVTELYLGNNRLTGLTMPDSFKSEFLKTIILINNNISTVTLNSLNNIKEKFPSLTGLDLRKNKLTPESIEVIKNFNYQFKYRVLID